MAEQKKGFILYADQKALFEQLPNEKAGELIKFIFAYVNDENPISEDIIINLAFTPIKQQLKRDLVKFLVTNAIVEEVFIQKSLLEKAYKFPSDIIGTKEIIALFNEVEVRSNGFN
jgi:hypothetical protein